MRSARRSLRLDISISCIGVERSFLYALLEICLLVAAYSAVTNMIRRNVALWCEICHFQLLLHVMEDSKRSMHAILYQKVVKVEIFIKCKLMLQT